MQLNILYMIFIGLGRPHETRKQNIIELTNEFLTVVATYHLISFSDMVSDIETKFTMGYSMIGNVAIIMLFNILNIILVSAHNLHASYRKRKFKKRYDE